MKIKGQVLLFVMLFLILAWLLCGGLMQLWQSQVQIPPLQEQGIRAYYLAQAGIERAKREVVNDVTLSGGPTPWYTDLEVSGDNFLFDYNFLIVIGVPTTIRILTANGRVRDLSGNLLAQKQIVVTVTNIEDTPPITTADDTNDGDVTVWN